MAELGLPKELTDIVVSIGLVGEDQIKTALDNIGIKSDTTAKALTLGLNAALSAGVVMLYGSVNAASHFENAMSTIKTATDLPKESLTVIGDSLQKISMNTGFDVSELAGGMRALLTAGYPAAEATQMLASAAEAAAGGMTSIDTAVTAGLQNLQNYNLPASELQHVFDLMFTAIKGGAGDFDTLQASIAKILPDAAQIGVPLETLYGVFSAVDKENPERAAVGLMRFFDKIVDSKDKFAQAGIIIEDVNGQMDFESLLTQIKTATEGMSQIDLQGFIDKLGLSSKAKEFLTNALTSYDDVIKGVQAQENAGGALEAAFQARAETFDFRMEQIKQSVNAAVTNLGQTFLPTLEGIAKAVATNPEAVTLFVTAIGAVTIGLGGLAAAVRTYATVAPVFQALMSMSFGPVGLAVAALAAALGLAAVGYAAWNNARVEEIDGIGREVDEVDRLTSFIDALKNKKSLTRGEEVALGKAMGDLNKILEAQGLKAATVADNMSAIATNTREVAKEEVKQKIEKLGELLNTLNATTGPSQTGLETGFEILANKKVIENVAEQLQHAKDRLKELEDTAPKANKNLKDLSTDLNDSITPRASAYNTAVGLLSGNLAGMNGQLKEQALQQAAANGPIKTYADMLPDFNLELGGMRSHYEGINLVGPQVAGQFKDIGDKTKDLKEHAGIYVGYLGTLLQKLGQGGNTTLSTAGSILGTMANNLKSTRDASGQFNINLASIVQAADPVTLGINLLAKGIGSIFGGDNKKVPDTIETVKDSFEKMGVAVRDAESSIASLTGEFSGVKFFENMQTALEAAEKNVLKYQNAGAQWMPMLLQSRSEVTRLTAQIQQLSAAFSFTERFDDATDGLNSMAAAALKFSTQFGNISTALANGQIVKPLEQMIGVIDATIWENQQMLNTLYPNTEAYKELEASIWDAQATLAVIKGQVASTTDWYIQHNIAVADATDEVTDLTIAYEGLLKTVFDKWEQWEKDAKTIASSIQKLLYFKIDVSTTAADEQIAASLRNLIAYQNTLNVGSQAYKDLQADINEMMIQYAATGASANKAAEALALQILEVREMIKEVTDSKQRDSIQATLDAMISRFSTLSNVLGQAASGGQTLHSGGIVSAHSGRLMQDEVMVKALRNEFMLRPAVTETFGAQRLLDFNATLNPAALSSRTDTVMSPAPKINVIVHNANPDTWVQITDKYVDPRIKQKDRKLTAGANPYAS